MANSSAMLRGIIHGKTIELESESGLKDGQEVSVEIRPIAGKRLNRNSRHAPGGWSSSTWTRPFGVASSLSRERVSWPTPLLSSWRRAGPSGSWFKPILS